MVDYKQAGVDIEAGNEVVRRIRATGASVFLDLKFYDIPNTVAQAVSSAASHSVDFSKCSFSPTW